MEEGDQELLEGLEETTDDDDEGHSQGVAAAEEHATGENGETSPELLREHKQ